MSEVTERETTREVSAHRDPSMDYRRQRDVMVPPADVFEHADGLTVLLDVAGVSKDDLNISTDRNELLVEGELAVDLPEDAQPLHADVRTSRYRRSFSLAGEQLDLDRVEASLRDGVLRIDIPARAELRLRKIDVKTG